MTYEQINFLVAAILAANPEQTEEAAVARYRKVLAELRRGGNVEKDADGQVMPGR